MKKLLLFSLILAFSIPQQANAQKKKSKKDKKTAQVAPKPKKFEPTL